MSARVVSEVLRDWLQGNRPEGLTGEIRHLGERERKERPQVVVLATAAASRHPLMKRYAVTLQGEWVSGKDEGGLFPAAVAVLARRMAFGVQSMAPLFAAAGMRLRKIVPGTDDERVDGDDGRVVEWPFEVIIQEEKATPAGVVWGDLDGGDADDFANADDGEEQDGGGA